MKTTTDTPTTEAERAWWNDTLHALRVYLMADLSECERARQACRRGISPSVYAETIMERVRRAQWEWER